MSYRLTQSLSLTVCCAWIAALTWIGAWLSGYLLLAWLKIDTALKASTYVAYVTALGMDELAPYRMKILLCGLPGLGLLALGLWSAHAFLPRPTRPSEPRTSEPAATPLPESHAAIPIDAEDDPMRYSTFPLIATLLASPAFAAKPTPPKEPTWPDNGIAQRELFIDDEGPSNMFVEYTDQGEWIAWVLVSKGTGPAKAINFFSGEVLENIKVKNPGDYNDSFVDAQGHEHKNNQFFDFAYKDPRPGGGLAEISFAGPALDFEPRLPCTSPYLRVSERKIVYFTELKTTTIWSKVPLYKDRSTTRSKCPHGVWDSLIHTAMNLRDGTLLVTGGTYVFRIRQEDFSPTGAAPALHVFDAAIIENLIKNASEKDITDGSFYLSQQLGLPLN